MREKERHEKEKRERQDEKGNKTKEEIRKKKTRKSIISKITGNEKQAKMKEQCDRCVFVYAEFLFVARAQACEKRKEGECF